MSEQEKSDNQPFHLTGSHIKILCGNGMVIPNQDGKDMVNFDDSSKPSIQNIISFTIPLDVLPNNAVTFGDLLKFSSTQSSTRSSGVFTCDDESQNSVKMVSARLLTFLTALMCDDSAGSKPHVDYFAEINRQKNEAAVASSNKPTQTDTKASDKQNNSTTSLEKNTVEKNKKKEKKKVEKTKEGGDDKETESSSSSDTTTSSSSSEESSSDDDDDTSKDGKAESTQKSSTSADKTKTGSENNIHTANTLTLSKKKHKTSEDYAYDKMLQDMSIFLTKKDVRGISLHQNYLFFKYNTKPYPKFRIFVEELEGHKSMPMKHLPVTNRVMLYRTHDRHKEMVQTTEEKDADEAPIGNGYLVGLRIWIFILDPGLILNSRIKKFIQEQDKRNMTANLVKHPNHLYTAPMDGITSESYYNSHVLLPYVSYGSYFRHVNKDPVVKSITKARQEYGFGGRSRVFNGANTKFNRDLNKVVIQQQKQKYANSFKDDTERDPGKVGRNESPSLVIREDYANENGARSCVGLSDSAFITNMGSVSDLQRNPRNYYKASSDVIEKKNSKKKTETVGDDDQIIVSEDSQKKEENDIDGMDVDTELTKPKKKKKTTDVDDLGNDNIQSEDENENEDEDPSLIDLRKPLHSAQSSGGLESKNGGEDKEDIFDDIIEDEKSDIDDSIDEFVKSDRVRIVAKVEENSYLLTNKKRVYGTTNPEEQEEQACKNYEFVCSVSPSSFCGFPCPQRITEYKNTYFGANFVNAPFPHIIRQVADEDYKKVYAMLVEQQYRKDLLTKAKYSQSITSSKDTQKIKEHGSILDNALSKPKNTDDVSKAITTKPTTDIYENPHLKFVYNIHRSRIPTKRVIKINDNDFDSKKKTAEQLKASINRIVSQMNDNDPTNSAHSTYIMYTSHRQLNILTSRDIEFHINGGRDVILTEISRNHLTSSELECFAEKNDLLMLRLRYCVEASNIGAQYSRSDKLYRKAMRELKKRQTNDYVHVLQHSTKIPKSLRDALQWYMKQAARKKQFAVIPLIYKQFGIFGNFFQFIRGVLAEVMLGRNNVELFFMMYFVYQTSLCYTFYLRPNFLASGPPTSSKSFNKDCNAQLAVPGTFINTTHTTDMHLMQSDDYYYMVHAYDEAPALFSAHHGGKSKGAQNSEAGGGGSRIMKEMISAQKVNIRTFFFEKDEKGKPKRKTDEIQVIIQITMICLCNLETLPPDSPLMQRFLFYVQPKKITEKEYKANGDDLNKGSKSANALKIAGTQNVLSVDAKQQENNREYDGSHIYSRSADLKRISVANLDYHNPEDSDVKEICQLIAFYNLLHETMITACVTEDISLDLAERWLPEIFDTFTNSIGENEVSPRIMMQGSLIARAMAGLETVVTVLFNNILYLDVKKEKTIVVSDTSKLEPRDLLENATGLNISKFRKYCRRHAFVTAEHVATTATMMEHFVSNPYYSPVVNTAMRAAGWPESITLNNLRIVSKTDESVNFSRITRDSLSITNMAQVVDARYISLSDNTFDLIIRNIHNLMKDQIAPNDVSRTLAAQQRIYFNAHACVIMNSKWDCNGELDIIQNEKDEEKNKKGKKGKDKQAKKKRKRVSSAERALQRAQDGKGDESEEEERNSEESEESEDNSEDYDNNKTSVINRKLQTDKNETWHKKCEQEGRQYIEEKETGGKLYIPDTVSEMQIWLTKKYASFQDMRIALANTTEREALGITDYKVFKNGNEIWMIFSEKIIKPEKIPVVRYETDYLNSRKRISFLIEYSMNENHKSMKAAIQQTFASNSIPDEGVIYQSIKPYVGLNDRENRFESSSYLTDIIPIPKVDRNLFCLNAISSNTTGRRYIDCKQLSLGGIFGENSPHTRAEKQFTKISEKIAKMTDVNLMEDMKQDDAAEDNIIDSESDSDDDEEPYKGMVDKPKRSLCNPYIEDEKIRNIIRNSSGVSFSNVSLNEYAQLRHWFRSGINPLTPVLLELPSESEDQPKKLVQIPKYMVYSTEYITKLIYIMNSTFQKSPEHEKYVCANYEMLWLEECQTIYERKRRCEENCVKTTSVFESVYSGVKLQNHEFKDIIMTDSGGNENKFQITSMGFEKGGNISDLTKMIFGKSDDYSAKIVGPRTEANVKKMIKMDEKKIDTGKKHVDIMSPPLVVDGQEETFLSPKGKGFLGYAVPSPGKLFGSTPSKPSTFFNPASPSSVAPPGFSPVPKIHTSIISDNPPGTPITQHKVKTSQMFSPQLINILGKRSLDDSTSEQPTKKMKVDNPSTPFPILRTVSVDSHLDPLQETQ